MAICLSESSSPRMILLIYLYTNYNKNKKFRSFKNRKHIFLIRKTEDGLYLGFSYKSLISDHIRSDKGSQRKILLIGKFNRRKTQRIVLLAHLSRRLLGELIVYPCPGVRRCLRRRRCRSQFSNIFSSKTARPIKAKYYVEPPWKGGTKVCINGPGHMTVVDTVYWDDQSD